MRRAGMILMALVLLLWPLSACQGYSQTGVSTSSHQSLNGGDLGVRIRKANGTSKQDIEVEGRGGLILEADVTLSVEKGSFKIELLGQGDDDPVTLVLEAGDGQTVSGHGQMVADAFGEASYRVTAVEAENVEYTIEYAFR